MSQIENVSKSNTLLPFAFYDFVELNKSITFSIVSLYANLEHQLEELV